MKIVICFVYMERECSDLSSVRANVIRSHGGTLQCEGIIGWGIMGAMGCHNPRFGPVVNHPLEAEL